MRGPLQAEHKGTGLGLPYARRVVQTLGGRMSLQSEPGVGSVFVVTIPRESQPLLAAAESPGRRERRDGKPRTVLIIDDDEGFRTALRGMLQDAVDKVVEARDGSEGLRLMRVVRPDVTFLDLRMPDMDGADVLAAISADPALQAIPVVIVTSTQLGASHRATLGAAAGLLAKANVNRERVVRLLTEVSA